MSHTVPHINLLPWRERLRSRRKRQFISAFAAIVIAVIGLTLLLEWHFSNKMDVHLLRNQFLRTEIAALDEQVEEMSQLRQQTTDTHARMNAIASLQSVRPVIVRIFDELVKTLPNGVYYQSVSRTENRIDIEGVAESYARITELMRQLDESRWFADPELNNISALNIGESVTSASSLVTNDTVSTAESMAGATASANQPVANAYDFSLSLTVELH
ncbi:MAG: PilN domain-containing protein [Pseudohongiellaceae bacterium]